MIDNRVPIVVLVQNIFERSPESHERSTIPTTIVEDMSKEGARMEFSQPWVLDR